MPRPNLDRFTVGWRGPLLAALVALLAGLPVLLMTPVLDRTEARVAEVSARMLATGDLTDTRFAPGEPRRTAPGTHWAQAVAAMPGAGSTEGVRDIRPYRLPSLLGAMLAAAACAWGAAALFGARAGFLAGALLGASFLLSTLAGTAQSDALLAGAAILMMAALGRLYVLAREGEAEAVVSGGVPAPLPRPLKLAFWSGLGLSILTGGSAGALIAAVTLITLGIWDRRWRWMARLGWGWGLPLLAVMTGPWAVAAVVATDGEVLRQILTDNSFARAFRGEIGWSLPGRGLLTAPLLLFPATLVLPAALMAGLNRRAEPGVRFAVAWLVPSWLLLELAPGVQWSDALPLYGALAWLAAAALVRPLGPVSRLAGTALAVLGGLYVLGFTLFALSEYGGPAARIWATPAIGLTLAAALIGGFLLYHRLAVTAVLASLALGVLAHASLAGMIRNLEPLWVSPRLGAAMMEAGLHPGAGGFAGPLAVTGYAQPSVTFLFGSGARPADAAAAARALAEGRPAVVEAAHEPAFRRALVSLGAGAVLESRIDGVNYVNGDRVSLGLYRPETAGEAP